MFPGCKSRDVSVVSSPSSFPYLLSIDPGSPMTGPGRLNSHSLIRFYPSGFLHQPTHSVNII